MVTIQLRQPGERVTMVTMVTIFDPYIRKCQFSELHFICRRGIIVIIVIIVTPVMWRPGRVFALGAC